MSFPNKTSKVVQTLLDAIEKNPEKKWKEIDFQNLSIDASTARRQFKKRFNMTFIAYARARRMGIAMKQIRKGKSVIDTQLLIGYSSDSGFRDAFSKIMQVAPSKGKKAMAVQAIWIDTPIGPMVAIGNNKALYLLEFADRRGLEKEIETMRNKLNSAITPGTNAILTSVKKELEDYFAKKLKKFTTPIYMLGSPFQKLVWEQLIKIPYGTTCSYGKLARSIDKPTAYRAVANANGKNQLAIIIPCHRVINTGGALGGYVGGINRKKWMLDHENSK